MKRKLLLKGLIVMSITLVSCSKKEVKKTERSLTQETIETKEKTESARFKGEIIEPPMIDGETVRLTFENVTAVEDPEKVIDSLNANGVVLLANIESMDINLETEDLEVGSELEFTLASPPAMTFSIPPQISGNSILEVKRIK